VRHHQTERKTYWSNSLVNPHPQHPKNEIRQVQSNKQFIKPTESMKVADGSQESSLESKIAHLFIKKHPLIVKRSRTSTIVDITNENINMLSGEQTLLPDDESSGFDYESSTR
jgi:hypothetical protein